jgi:hypothetical protein
MKRRHFLNKAGSLLALLPGLCRAEAGNHQLLAATPLEPLHVRDFGAAGDGINNDLSALRSAWNAAVDTGRDLAFDPGRYWLGTVSDDAILFPAKQLSGFRLWGHGATLELQTLGAHRPIGFQISDFQDCAIDGITWTDRGADLRTQSGGPFGLIAFQIYAGGPGRCQGFRLSNCATEGAVVFFQATGSVPAQSGKGGAIEDIEIAPSCRARDTFYGISTQNVGNRLKAALDCENVGRAYFSYGARDHEVVIRAKHDGSQTPAANTCCLISADWLDVKGIKLTLVLEGDASHWSTGIAFNTQSVPGTGDRTIAEVTAYLDTARVTTFGDFVPYAFRSYVSGQQQKSTSDHYTGLTLDGNVENLPASNDLFRVFSVQDTQGALSIGASLARSLRDSGDWPGFLISRLPG